MSLLFPENGVNYSQISAICNQIGREISADDKHKYET